MTANNKKSHIHSVSAADTAVVQQAAAHVIQKKGKKELKTSIKICLCDLAVWAACDPTNCNSIEPLNSFDLTLNVRRGFCALNFYSNFHSNECALLAYMPSNVWFADIWIWYIIQFNTFRWNDRNETTVLPWNRSNDSYRRPLNKFEIFARFNYTFYYLRSETEPVPLFIIISATLLSSNGDYFTFEKCIWQRNVSKLKLNGPIVSRIYLVKSIKQPR